MQYAFAGLINISSHDLVFVAKFCVVGVLFGAIFFYLLWSLVAGTFLKIDFYRLSLYMTVGFLVAVIFEPLCDYIYKYMYGSLLWEYQVLPIFGGASSGIAFLTWPFYGYHAYFFMSMLRHYHIKPPAWLINSMAGIDGVPFDIIANGASLVFFQIFFFYYPRPELWHLSALWVIPFYWATGIIYALTLHGILTMKKRWSIPIACYSLGCAVMVVGEIAFQQGFFR